MSLDNHLIDLSKYENKFEKRYEKDLRKYSGKITGTVKVLYIGLVIQKSMLGPFIKAICKVEKFKNKAIEVYTLGRKEAKGFDNGPFKTTSPLTKDELCKLNKNVDKVVFLEEPDLYYEKLKTEFHFIFCSFEMQNSRNWRYLLLSILKNLEKGGTFYFAELGGDISMLDGHFRDLSNTAKTVVEKFIGFKKKRNEVYYWNPEISITNYREVAKFLWKIFDRVKEKEFKGSETIPVTSENIKQNHQYSFTFLSHELDGEETCKQDLQNIDQVELSHSLKLYSAIGYKKITKEHFSNRASNSLAESIRTINDYSLKSIGKKFLQLSEHHDLLFPHTRIYEGIFIPSDIDSVLNGQLIKRDKVVPVPEGESPSKRLFVDMMFDVPVMVIYLKDNYHQKKDKAKWVSNNLGQQIAEVGIVVKRNENGEIKYIKFFINKNPINEIKNRQQLKEIKAELFKSNEIGLANAMKLNSLIQLLEDIGEFHLWRKDFTSSTIITYFPSSIKSTKSLYNHDIKGEIKKSISQHIGSIFILERWYVHKDEYFKYLVNARNDILSRMADYILHRLNLVHSINNYKRFARRAAIAAISARNVSHNIGSHVIPSIKKLQHANKLEHIKDEGRASKMTHSYVKEILQSEISESIKALSRYDTFLEYVSQRNDFVNQLTSANTSWSISVWFVRELMARFMNQYFLLNSLGAHEGLSVYDFNKYRKFKSKKQANSTSYTDYVHFLDENTAANVMIYGNIIVTENNEFYILQKIKGSPDRKVRICNNTWKKGEEDLNTTLNFIRFQDNRKFRIAGSVKSDYPEGSDKNDIAKNRNLSFLLKEGEFISGNIVIKVRLRKYVKIEETRWSKPYAYSEYMGRAKFFDLRSKEYINLDIENEIKKSEENIYYGIILSINNENNLVIVSTWDKVVSVQFSEKIPEDSRYLKPGARIVFSADKDKLQKIVGGIKFVEATLKEMSVTEHLLTTGPSVTYDDILKNDIKVSIPGGISGYQSFYTILENVIRNSVKHNWVHLPPEEKIGRNLELKIDISRISDIDHYIIKVWTNLTDLRYPKAIVEYKDDHQRSTPPESNTIPDSLTNRLNNIYKTDIIKNNTGDFVRSDLGSMETKINAAYLYNSAEELISNSTMKENVLLDDKTYGSIEKGYIRTSHIYEFYKEEIVPKLGLRFKIKRPTELSVYTNHPELLDLVIKDDTIQVLDKDNFENTSTIQGDICLLMSDVDNWNEKSILISPNGTLDSKNEIDKMSLLKLIDHIVLLSYSFLDQSSNTAFKENLRTSYRKVLLIFADRIEEYPFRLIYAHSTKGLISSLKSNVKELFTDLNKEDKQLFDFFTKRVYFLKNEDILNPSGLSIKEDEIYNKLAMDSDRLKLYLYDKWLCRHVLRDKQKKAINLNIQIFLSNTKNVPMNLGHTNKSASQYPDISNVCNSLDSRIIYPNIDQKEHNNISYTRHGYNTKYNHTERVYCENVSGSKLSYNLFSILASSDLYNKLKIKLRLKENALLKYLILDERLMKFAADSSKEVIERFHSMGIAIPHVFKNNDDLLTGALSFPKILAKDYTSEFLENALKVEEIDNYKLEYLLPYNKQVEYEVINAIVIHQSILEKMVEGSIDPVEDKMNEIILSFKKVFHSVIVTSGRNKASYNISARFLPFSVIEELLYNENPDKINFTETIIKTNL